MLRLSEFWRILAHAVSVLPGLSHGPRLNTWAVIDQESQLSEDGLGLVWGHYESGMYWSRDWYLRGAQPSEGIKKQYGILVGSHTVSKRAGMLRGDIDHIVYLTAVDQIGCEGCPGNRTEEQVDEDCRRLLLQVLSYLEGLRKYEVIPAAGDPYIDWLHPQEATYLPTTAAVNAVEDIGGELVGFISQPNPDVWKGPISVDHCRRVTLELMISDCVDDIGDLDFSTGFRGQVSEVLSKKNE